MPMRDPSDPLYKVDPFGTQMDPFLSWEHDDYPVLWDNYVEPFLDDLWTGAKNAWYDLTGQPEKTSSYKAMIEHEDNAPQKFIESLEKAGLSKYSYNGGQVGTPSAPASDPVAKQMETQQLKSLKIANEEAEHDLSIAKLLGIRSGDTNYAAKWAELGNVLFNFDPTKVEGGLIPWLFKNLKKFFTGRDESDPEPEPETDPEAGSTDEPSSGGKADWAKEMDYDMNPVLPGASYDTWKAIGSDLSKLREPGQVEDFVSGIIKSADFKGIGKNANYSTLPDDKTLGVKGYSFEDDIEHFISEMIANGVDQDEGIRRIAEFIAKKYNKDVDYVFKRLKNGVTFIVEGR